MFRKLRVLWLRLKIWNHEIEIDQLNEINNCKKSDKYKILADKLNLEYCELQKQESVKQ